MTRIIRHSVMVDCPPDALLVDLEKELLQIDATIRYINEIDVIVSKF
jgi:hypothetical protein